MSPTPSLAVGSRWVLRIDRLALGGHGVGRLSVGQAGADSRAVFVPYACPGDTVEIQITELHRHYARARLLQVMTASRQRIAPPCPYHFHISSEYGRLADTKLYCGGCSWQHIAYSAQLDIKRQLVQETLERIGGVRGVDVRPVLGMSEPWRYRNKVQQPVGWDGRRLISGFYAPFSHDLVPIEECLVQSELSVRILNRTRALLGEFRLAPYEEKRHRGWIRHLWLRTSSADGRALLALVTRMADFPHESEIAAALVREFPELVGIHQNVNPGKTNVILGRAWRKVCGSDFLEERLGNLRFLLSPGSFFQVNTPQTEVLYGVLQRLAGPGQRLLDLYCGAGGIALWLAKQFQEVLGVDETRSAIRDAERNARLNGISNARFAAEPVERFLHQFSSRFTKNLTVVLDPPRAGCSAAVLQSLLRLKPNRLIYVSCDPATLARDLALLARGGYRARQAQPVDLFPHTPHIETVVGLFPEPAV